MTKDYGQGDFIPQHTNVRICLLQLPFMDGALFADGSIRQHNA